MITSVFKKSTPLNFFSSIFDTSFLLFTKFKMQAGLIHFYVGSKTWISCLLGSVFITNFISKKNGLSKDSAYTVFLFFC
jgi:hypothetical protein